MKWYLLTVVLYSSFWWFLGWGIQGETIQLVISLGCLLASSLIAIFNFKKKLLKEALMILYAPSMIIYAILRSYDSMSNWKVVFIIAALLIQGILLFLYYKTKRKRAM